MRTREEIQNDLNNVDRRIVEMCFAGKIEDDYWLLKKQASALREELQFLAFRRIATDGEIDIYENPVERGVKQYHITLHDIPQEIGHIKISYGAHVIPRYGHIGYEIASKYRGHNYTSRALEMLVDEMIEKGLEEPTLAAFPHNLPSVHIIEKFGGNIIHEAKNKFDWNIYQVNLLEKRKSKALTK